MRVTMFLANRAGDFYLIILKPGSDQANFADSL